MSPICRLPSSVSRRSRLNCVLLVMVNGRGGVMVSRIKYGKQAFNPVNHVGQRLCAVLIFVKILVADEVCFPQGITLVVVKAVFEHDLAGDVSDVLMGVMRPAPLFCDDFERLNYRAPRLFAGL